MIGVGKRRQDRHDSHLGDAPARMAHAAHAQCHQADEGQSKPCDTVGQHHGRLWTHRSKKSSLFKDVQNPRLHQQRHERTETEPREVHPSPAQHLSKAHAKRNGTDQRQRAQPIDGI